MKWEDCTEEASNSLNKTLAQYCDKNITGVEPLRKITLVGAIAKYPKNKTESLLRDNDFHYLEKTLQELTRAGVPIAADFRVDVVNITEGRNFLKETDKTDIVIICNLPPNLVIDFKYDILDWEEYKTLWKDRIKQSGAKIISAIGWKNCHLSQEIEGDYAPKLLSASSHVCKPDFDGMPSTVDIDCSIMMRPDYISSIAPYLDKKTELGENAKAEHKKILEKSKLIGTREASSPPLPPRK